MSEWQIVAHELHACFSGGRNRCLISLCGFITNSLLELVHLFHYHVAEELAFGTERRKIGQHVM